MDELVQHIEDRIRVLLKKYTDLKMNHIALDQTNQRLSLENDHLLLKHKNVVGLVEHTIAKLKSIEGLT